MLQNASASYLRAMKKIAVMVILRCGTKYLLLLEVMWIHHLNLHLTN